MKPVHKNVQAFSFANFTSSFQVQMLSEDILFWLQLSVSGSPVQVLCLCPASAYTLPEFHNV